MSVFRHAERKSLPACLVEVFGLVEALDAAHDDEPSFPAASQDALDFWDRAGAQLVEDQ
jgi:hypothetical protein